MVRLIGRTSLRRSPKSEHAKNYLSRGASVTYLGSTDIVNASSAEELSSCISKVLELPSTQRTKIFINSQDYLRVVSEAKSGRVILCIPVDVIVNCVLIQEKYIVFCASTSINPTSHTVSMAHIFQSSCERNLEVLYDAMQRTIDSVKMRGTVQEDVNKITPLFSKVKPSHSFANIDSNFVLYHANIQNQSNSTQTNTQTNTQQKLAVTNHALFRNAFECVKHGDQDKLHSLLHSDLKVLFADDGGQTLLHLSVRLDKLIMCKFLLTHCCSSTEEQEKLRCVKDKEGMTALHLATIYGLTNIVKLLAKDYKSVNIKDIKGRIPLHYCAGKLVYHEMTHILVGLGSRIEEKEVDGIKPSSIEPALKEIQKLSVSGAFKFINNLNFLDRSGKRIDSGVDITCSEKTVSEPEIVLGGSVQSADSCYSPRQDHSLSSIPEQDRLLRPPTCGSVSSSQCEEDNASFGGGSSESSPTSITDKMKVLREELSRLINLLMNPECHKYLLPQMSQEKAVANKLIIIAQYPLLTDDCAQAIALMLHYLFKPSEVPIDRHIKDCVENGLLKTLVKLLDSHVTIQTQAISILEEVFSKKKGGNSEADYISDFADLDPELVITLIHENDLPVASSAKQKQQHSEMLYAKRLRSLSSPSEMGDSLKNGNSYFTKNWSRRLLIRILSRASLTRKMRLKMNSAHVVKGLLELVSCPTMELKEHAVCTLANMALSVENHDILCEHGIPRRFKETTMEEHNNNQQCVLRYHCTRGLVYLGYTEVPVYVYEHNLKGQGIEDDRIWAGGGKDASYDDPDSHYVKAATLEDIIVIMTSDPSLLWNNIPLRLSYNETDTFNTTTKDREIIRFVLSLHKTFADTLVLFRLLVHRFSDPNVLPAKRYHQQIPPVHTKVCMVLCVWMEEFPYHFMEEPAMLAELEEFVVGLEDYGPVYYDLRDQIALKSQIVHVPDRSASLDRVTHLDHYKHCRVSFINEDFPLSVYAVSWLSALRGVTERASVPEQPQGFFRSLLNSKERETSTRLKSLIPPSYQTHPDVLQFTKHIYTNLANQNLGDREWQHLFVEAYFSHPLYKTSLFYDLYSEGEDLSTTPVIVGVNEHHLVVVNRLSNEIIGHHPLTNLQKPIQWLTDPVGHVLTVAMEQEYRLIGQNPSDIEMLATLLVQYMGDKIELVDNTFFIEEEDWNGTERIVTNNRHSWHANTKNGYARIEGYCPPTTPCRNSINDVSKVGNEHEVRAMSTARSRLSLNLSFLGNQPIQENGGLRRVHTTNDVRMSEALKLVEFIPRPSLTDRLKNFSDSITSKLDKVEGERHEDDSDEDVLPKVNPHDSLIGPPRPSKRSLRRSPRISPKISWEKGVVRIDPETAQETVIITEKCNVLFQLKGSGASTPSTPPDHGPGGHHTSHPHHLRVRNTSSFRNIDTAAFTQLLAQSMEMIEERKKCNRRNSLETLPRKHSTGSGITTSRGHRPVTRSKSFNHTFEKLVSADSPSTPAMETPVELERFTCLKEDRRVKRAQDTVFHSKCDCPEVSHYIPCPCPPSVDLPYDFSFSYRRLDEVKLLGYHREVARQLTLREHELFADINEADLLGYTVKRDQPMQHFPSVYRCKEHFQKICDVVKTMVLECELREIRVKILEHFIDISHQCVLLRNFSSLFAITISALSSAAIQNLTYTWNEVSPVHQDLFQELLDIFSSTLNYKIYKKLLQTGNSPTVPFLQIYIKQFLMINEKEGNPDYLRKGLINLQKRRLIYRELEEVRHFQNLKYNFTEVPEMLAFFMNYETAENEDFYLRSVMVKRNDENNKHKKNMRRRMTYS